MSRSYCWGALILLFVFSCIVAELSLESRLLLAVGSSTKLLIVPVNALGLANRLRTISSLYTISSSRGLKLVVIWGRSSECAAMFQDLFYLSSSANFAVLDTYDLTIPESEGEAFARAVRLSVSNLCQGRNHTMREVVLERFLVEESFDANFATSIVWTRGSHAALGTSCGSYLYSKSLFYRNLIPSYLVQQYIDSVEIKDFNSGEGVATVGVHIRAFDAQYDWSVVSPTMRDETTLENAEWDPGAGHVVKIESKRFDQTSSLDSFIQLMSHMIKQNNGVRFYLASNSISAKIHLLSHFGAERILTLKYSSSSSTRSSSNPAGSADSAANNAPDYSKDGALFAARSSVEGVALAAAEFWLLGETSFIVHSRASSFAREAAHRYMVSVVDVTMDENNEGVYFFSQRDSLPFCGMPEFIRSSVSRSDGSIGTGSSSRRICYKEDSRSMCTVVYHVCPCPDHYQLVGGIYYHDFLCNSFNLDDDTHTSSSTHASARVKCATLLAESNGYSM
mmetsp:Transcript_4369/g.7109  ORF Transcript_4369/g.7109 Transcript_4369/m.7109 type:complete len:508 (-) Transcript_4369:198-1721(-)